METAKCDDLDEYIELTAYNSHIDSSKLTDYEVKTNINATFNCIKNISDLMKKLKK